MARSEAGWQVPTPHPHSLSPLRGEGGPRRAGVSALWRKGGSWLVVFQLAVAAVLEEAVGLFEGAVEEGGFGGFGGRSRACRWRGDFFGFGDEGGALGFEGLGAGGGEGAVEIFFAVDPSLLADGGGVERGAGPEGEVGVFAGFEGADVLVDAELFGGVEGDEFEGFDFRGVAVFHGFGGVEVEAAGEVGGVGVEGDDDAAVAHEAAVVGDGVIDLEFEGPPVGEGGAARAVTGDFVGDFVAFEDVLEAGDFDVERFHRAEERDDFVLPVGVAVNPALAEEDFAEGFEFEVAADGRAAVFFLAVEGFEILARGGETVVHEGGDAHAGLREARGVFGSPVGLLHVFAEGEFYAGGGFGEFHLLGRGTEAEFDDGVLAADGIGGAVEEVGCGDAAGELLVNVFGLGVDDVGDADHGGGGERAFVDVAEDHAVAVGVDDAGGDVEVAAVEFEEVFAGGIAGLEDGVGAEADDAAVDGEEVGVLDFAGGAAGPEGGVFDEDGARGGEGAAVGLRGFGDAFFVEVAEFLGWGGFGFVGLLSSSGGSVGFCGAGFGSVGLGRFGGGDGNRGGGGGVGFASG